MIELQTTTPHTSPQDAPVPLCVPELSGNEWLYVKECLDTGWVSSVGAFVERFERELATKIGCRYAVATSSGTAALHTSLVALGIEPDDEVLVSALTFVAPANAIRYVGAWPVFIDAERANWQMDPQKVADFLKRECRWTKGELRNKATGRRVRAIVPVHILGHPVDLAPILDLAQVYNLFVIEDASESLGAAYRGHSVGQLGHLACFSFNGNKLMTTGGGGMITTNSNTWAQLAKYYSTQAKDDPIEYVHRHIGFNYRLTNVQAAMGCAQLEQLDRFVARKRTIARRYADGLADVPGITPMPEADWAHSAYWLYTILIEPQQTGIDSRELRKALNQRGVQSRPLWCPMPMLPIYQGDRSVAYEVEVAPWIYARALSLPSSVGLTTEAQVRVIEALRKLCMN